MSLYAQEVVCRLTTLFSTLKSTLKGKYDFRYITANFRLPKGDCFVQTATNAKLCSERPQSKALKPFADLCLFTHKKLFVV